MISHGYVPDALERIATALEEQNRICQEWIAAQVDWRAEDRLAREQLAERELRIIDIHQANAEREQAFRDTQIQAYSEHLKRQEEAAVETHEQIMKIVQAEAEKKIERLITPELPADLPLTAGPYKEVWQEEHEFGDGQRRMLWHGTRMEDQP
jgi:hypothetical protein